MSPMEKDEAAFWKEAARRRAHFFMWWMAWIPMGWGAFALWGALVGGEPPVSFMGAALIVWWAAWMMIARRLAQLRCPHCVKPALASPFFLMSSVHCRHCGMGKAD